MRLSRRRFMHVAGATGAAAALSPLASFYSHVAQGKSHFGAGFGALTPSLPVNAQELTHTVVGDLSNEPILALPNGFNYRVLSMTGDVMSDGSRVPAGHDGMAAFAGPRGATLLVRNHEIGTSVQADYAYPVAGGPRYSIGAHGGTTTIVVGRNREVRRHFVSLAGTHTNCAGGPTPWGSWLSCEETFSTTSNGGVSTRHGYVFEVVADANGGVVTPVPLKAMGRFSHEAAAVDPMTGYVYETEDRSDSCFYRFVPNTRRNLANGGELFAMRILAGPQNTTNNPAFGGTTQGIKVGESYGVDWVRVDRPDPDAERTVAASTGPNDVAVRYQAQDRGAAIFYRGEGAWYGNGLVYFVATQAGPAAPENLPSPPGNGRGNGQVWAYDPDAETVTLVVEAAPTGDLLDEPDNITVTPFGDLLLCEDSSDDSQHIVGVTAEGDLYHFAKNVLLSDNSDPDLARFIGNEFAGACFSPDGHTLFVNIQTPGMTFAIWGPWHKRVGVGAAH